MIDARPIILANLTDELITVGALTIPAKASEALWDPHSDTNTAREAVANLKAAAPGLLALCAECLTKGELQMLQGGVVLETNAALGLSCELQGVLDAAVRMQWVATMALLLPEAKG